jgi:hypothetical protein
MKHHGLILGIFQASHMHIRDSNWTSVKRAAGAYKIAHFMRTEGWDVEVLDFWLRFDYEEFKELISSRVTKDTKFIGLSLTFPITGKNVETALRYLSWIKRTYPDVAIVCGSKAIYTGIYLHEYVDYFVFGYGEYGFNELMKHILGKPSSVVIESKPAGVTYTIEHDEIKYVDCDKHHICAPQKDLTVIYEDRDFIMPNEHMTLEFARGCKFACKFCAYNLIGVKGDYTRDMENLGDELRRNYDSWGLTSYSVADETFNDSQDKMRAIVAETNKLPFNLDMAGYIRADLLAARPEDKELLCEMGFWGHFYGIESLNHASAKSIGKGLQTEKMKQGLLDARKYFETNNSGRYRATGSFICGLPYETPETYWDGINWWRKNMPKEHMVSFPLFITGEQSDVLFKGAQSEFDRTWKESGLFSEYTHDHEVGAKMSDINAPREAQEYIWNQYSTMTSARWKHDGFNWWTAHLEWGKTLFDPEKNRGWDGGGIGSWWFHHYHTTGMGTYEDLIQTPEANIDINEMMDRTEEFIEDYKWKKLSL